MEIDPGHSTASRDDSAMSGIGYSEFVRYICALRQFVDRDLRGFDVVLEKNWLLSGYVSRLCQRRGQVGIPVENIIPNPSYAAGGQIAKWIRLYVGRAIAGFHLRRAPLIIAETNSLKRSIERYWQVASERIAVVDLGVDRAVFHPIEQSAARRRLGHETDKTHLVYVGVLDQTHNLAPAIQALGDCAGESIELHVVGDGPRRREYEAMAAAGAAIVFHGRVPHEEVPWHIAAADLCIAPYDAMAFPSGELGYATMKIPEYMSVGRPVVSVPSGRIADLVCDGTTGFLFENERDRWRRFLARLPSRDSLAAMGTAAAAVKLMSWEDTAAAYLSLCENALAARDRVGR